MAGGVPCRSNLCERDWCLLNRRNPKKIAPVDIYSLISTFEGMGGGGGQVTSGRMVRHEAG